VNVYRADLAGMLSSVKVGQFEAARDRNFHFGLTFLVLPFHHPRKQRIV
jgi:hypothetical protein